jgi:predicted transcriptional regulator
MAMTLRLTEDEQNALRDYAEGEGVSMQDVARRAIRHYIEREQHRERVASAGRRVIDAHADALERLGQ